jgi:biopolymer transport protein ExbD
MKVSRKKIKILSVSDSGALSDLAFLLIIFFIVIAVFNINKGFMLGLPQKKSTKIVNVEEIVKVLLTSENKLIYKEEEYSLSDIEKLVKERKAIKPNMTFLLKIDPEARYQNVVSVVDVILQLDVDNFSFSMIEND